MSGRITRASLAPRERPKLVVPAWTWPVSGSEDGRAPRISDGRHTKADKDAGRARRVHRGQDIMYRRSKAARRPYDHPWSSKWYETPRGVRTPVLAAFTGQVIAAGIIDTGGLVMLDHGGGIGTGYHHMRGVLVGLGTFISDGPSLVPGATSLGKPDFSVGDTIPAGYPLGVVGGSPIGYGLVHLHFDYVTELDTRRSTLRRGRLAGSFQDAAKMMRKWVVISLDDAWADVGRA